MQAREHQAELYPHTPHEHIDWGMHRWPLVLQEIAHWQPDVVCLQEVRNSSSSSSSNKRHDSDTPVVLAAAAQCSFMTVLC